MDWQALEMVVVGVGGSRDNLPSSHVQGFGGS